MPASCRESPHESPRRTPSLPADAQSSFPSIEDRQTEQPPATSRSRIPVRPALGSTRRESSPARNSKAHRTPWSEHALALRTRTIASRTPATVGHSVRNSRLDSSGTRSSRQPPPDTSSDLPLPATHPNNGQGP